jgi:hypothetical protein
MDAGWHGRRYPPSGKHQPTGGDAMAQSSTPSIDTFGPAAATALQIAYEMYEKLIPLRPPANTSAENLAAALTTQAQQVGRLAWEILYGLSSPRRP